MKVEWDSKKNDINIKKHGISFDLAAKVFVVYTDREDAVRLISARLANTKGKEVYYDKKRKNK